MSKAIEIATKLIKLNEGCKLEVYTCPAGYKTFGYGTNLEVLDANSSAVQDVIELTVAWGDVDFGYRCKQTGLELAIDYISAEIKEKLANYFLQQEILNCRYALRKHSWFTNDLSEFQQAIILDLAYNIGVAGVLKFKKMIEAIKQRNYGIACEEMLDSNYHYQMICYGYEKELELAVNAGYIMGINFNAQVRTWYANLPDDSKKLRSASNAFSLQFDKPLGKYKEVL
jgi:lysozyme